MKQEFRMIMIGIGRRGIAAETFLPRVIVMINHSPLPSVLAFDPEMIVRGFAQLAGSCLPIHAVPRRQDNGRRYTRPLLYLRYRQRLIGIDNKTLRLH